MLYVNIMVIIKQKLIVNTQRKMRMRKESKHNTKESDETTRGEIKRRRKEQRQTTKTARKQLTKLQKVHTYQ